jgi:hypothetical protein
MPITKRLYNDGYYLSGKSGLKAVHNKKVEFPTKTDEHEYYVLTQDEQITSDVPVIFEQKNITQDNAVSNEKSFVEKNSKEPIQQKFISKVKSIKKNITYLKQNTCSINKTDNNADDSYSLLWILVLVLLILWGFGYLVGNLSAGGLINILLVIAFILFILWLLKIV